MASEAAEIVIPKIEFSESEGDAPQQEDSNGSAQSPRSASPMTAPDKEESNGQLDIPGSTYFKLRPSMASSTSHISQKIIEGGQVGFAMENNLNFSSAGGALLASIPVLNDTRSEDSGSKNSSRSGSATLTTDPDYRPPKPKDIKGTFLEKLTGGIFKSKKQIFKSKLPLDDYISILKQSNGKHEDACPIGTEDIEKICREARDLTMSQSVLLELQAPLQICGDIHGQFTDLLTMFEVCGDPSTTNYLFLGDYVDRGKQSIETILLLMCYKLKYPETFYLLRGNHECADVNRMYGFFDECKRRSKMKMWKEFTTYFDTLPLAAVIADKIFCVHGGLSPTLHSMNSIREVKRPCHIGNRGVEADLLWSDPQEGITKWELNEDRGVSFVFGPDIIDAFLAKFNFELIVRAHMVVEDGFEFFHGRKLVTIFTAPNYTGDFDNKGAIMNIDAELQISFKFLVPTIKTRAVRSNSNIRKNARGV